MSKLVKGSHVSLDAECYVYSIPRARREVPDEEVPEEPRETGPSPEEIAKERARQIYDEAERYDRDTRERADRDAQTLREQAKKEGYQEGYGAGRREALYQNEELLSKLRDLMAALDRGKDALFEKHEQEMVDLALEIGRKVVEERIERDDEAFTRIYKKAVEGLSDKKVIRLKVSEHKIEFATKHADYLMSMIPDAEKMEIKLVEGAPPGMLVVETEDVVIDASTHKQLEVVKQVVDDVRYGRNA